MRPGSLGRLDAAKKVLERAASALEKDQPLKALDEVRRAQQALVYIVEELEKQVDAACGDLTGSDTGGVPRATGRAE